VLPPLPSLSRVTAFPSRKPPPNTTIKTTIAVPLLMTNLLT
jgi:hypothetical protein